MEAISPCSICHEMRECRHFGLYVFGSEGVWLCHKCEMKVDVFIRDSAHAAMQVRMDEHMARKRRIDGKNS